MVSQGKPGVQERILLHLLDYSDFKDSIEVPFALSQMGIANAVAIARSNVPRAIAGLKDQGILVERQAHVKGVSRKRKAYFLTDSGVGLASETWERLAELPIRCLFEEKPAEETTLSGAKSVLPFQMRPVDIIRYMDDNHTLDLRRLSADLVERDLSKHVEKQLVTSLADLPRLRHFYGRATELDNMVNLLEARATTLLVPGIAGIGKTTVASKLIERFMHRRNLLYHRCQDWEGSRSFFESVADWLSSMGCPDFATYLAATPVPQPADAARLLVEALSGSPSLIVIDDFHKVADLVLHQTFQAMSLNLLGSDEQIGLVIFSRSFKPVVPTKDAEGRIASLVLPLDGLDPESGRKLLSSFETLADEQWLHIHGLSRGHPLVLELINRGASAGAFHETLENYVNVEIFSKLSAEQKRVLSALAIYREPVLLEALAQQGLNTDELDSLVESGLARQADAETYDVHDLIREFLLRSISSTLKQEFHAKCTEWYQKQPKNHDTLIELIYHAIQSVQHELASELIVTEGRQLVAQGHMELLGLIEQIDFTDLPLSVQLTMSQMQGEILALFGRLDEAETVLQNALSVAEKEADVLVQAEVLSSLADVSRKQGDSDLSLDRHKQALKHYIALGHARWAARTYNNIGYLLRRKNERNKALQAYGEVEAILASTSDDGLINSQITLARALIDLGEVDRAREHAMASHERTSQLEDSALHARAQAVLGRYYAKVGQSELALFHYSEALEAMNEAGDVQSLVEITMLLGEVLQDAGRTEEAMEHYGQALVLAESNDLRMQIGDLLARLGGMAPDRQDRMEYLQRALKVFRELGARNRMREVQSLVHRAVMGR
ncbi:MAG: tetratricopeptide repeat protein [Candidatus Poseidonia sp.]|nr:tetratricopeptide repeat protein [Poseidonia sp.]